MSDKELYRFIWDRVRPHKAWVIASLLLAGSFALAQVALASLVPKVHEALSAMDWDAVLLFCPLAIATVFWKGISNFLHRVFIRTATERTVRFIRNEIFDRFLVFSESSLSKHSTGKGVNHIVTDSMVIGLGLQVLSDLVKEPLTIIGLFGYLLYINWQLTLVCLIAIIPVSYVGKILGGTARRNQGRLQQSLEEVSKKVIDSMGGLRTAHSFNLTAKLQHEYRKLTQKTYEFLMRLCRAEEMVSPLTEFIGVLAGAVIVAFGAYLIIDQQSMTIHDLIGFVVAAGLIQQPLKNLNRMNVRIQQVLAATQRIHLIISEPLDDLSKDQLSLLESDKEGFLPPAPESTSHLEFKGVNFRYVLEDGALSSTHALKSINLNIEHGQKVALVGLSGSGKSTLSLLAMRFLDPVDGEVLLNGKNLKDWELKKLRSYFSYVSQDVYLFNRSLRENLLIARPDASDEELHSALRKANILEFVENELPQGMDTVLLERASNLSGGEKQRIAIARAFLKNAPFLVLDEATSQLDSHNEEIVQGALEELMKGRSVLVIAHRLSTIRECDEVLVMKQGQIIEQGSPKLLLESQGGAFAELWKKQFQNIGA